MPNLTTGFPERTGNMEKDYGNIYNWSISLVDELKYILCNLDSGNVTEASSVKAQNIDCTQARIKDAQMQSLKADKISAGTIDAGKITVKGESDNGKMVMSGETLAFYEKGNSKPRIYIGRDGSEYIFAVQSSDGTQGVYMDENGQVYMTGILSTDKDCLIQGALRVGLMGSNTKGIEFYGDSYSSQSECYAKMIPWVDVSGEWKGINIEGGLWINESYVATERDIVSIQKQIDRLTSQVKELQDKIAVSE